MVAATIDQSTNASELEVIDEGSDGERSFPWQQANCASADINPGTLSILADSDLSDIERVIMTTWGLTRKQAILGMIANGIDSVQMVEWMMNVSWETYTEMVDAIVLDAHLMVSLPTCR